MNEKQRQRKKIFRICVVIIAVVCVLSALLLTVKYWENSQTQLTAAENNEDEEQKIRYDGKWYRLKEDIQTVLVIGLDKLGSQASTDSYNNDSQADFLMLLIIDSQSKTCTPLHINRDSMADVSVLDISGDAIDTVKEQLALSHTYGSGSNDSCRNTASAVSSFLYDVPVDHYISLTMDAVETLNDLVGGVEVTVLDDFSNIDETLKEGEKVTLLGQHALNYVRSRYGLEDSSNVQRMARQRQYLNALYQKCLEYVEKYDSFAVDAMMKLNDYMVSDCSITQLQTILNNVVSYEIEDIQTIEGNSIKGETYMEFYPDEDALQKQIVELFYECIE